MEALHTLANKIWRLRERLIKLFKRNGAEGLEGSFGNDSWESGLTVTGVSEQVFQRYF